jgi:protein-S-isoprenylcysteine O-methyltransferase Ste14
MTTMQICSLLWTVLLVVWLIAWLRTKRTQERAPFVSRLAYGVPVGLASWLLFSDNLPFTWLQDRIIPKNIYTEATAITLTALGIAFAIWARFYLGQNWSSAVGVKVGHELIRTGPYAWVRHPIYSGLILAMIGTAMARREPRGFFSVVLLWLGFLIKSRMEEKFMRKTFGPDYEDYSKSTGALVPRLRM